MTAEEQRSFPRSDQYPRRTRRAETITALKEGVKTWIAGRLRSNPEGGWILADTSGRIMLDGVEELAVSGGAIVEVEGILAGKRRFRVERIKLLSPGRERARAGSRNEALWNLPKDIFRRRRLIRDGLRTFFLERGFDEVESPVLVPAPGQEPYLDPFVTRLDTDQEVREERYLITSPEYFHKRLLAAGFEKIFEIARVFRNGPSETRGLHHAEFCMVEWYRAYASYLEIMEDMEQLIHHLALRVDCPLAPRFEPPYERLTMKDAFHRYAGVDLDPYLQDDPSFAAEQASRGDFGLMAGDDQESRFFKILVAAIEPQLGRNRPVFLIDFPACQASLSKICEDRPEVCERFELYINGVELANGFTELNDPEEQRARFRKEAMQRAARGREPVPQDEDFLEALRLGMPPAGGVALGLERLMMVLLGERDMKDVAPFMYG
jgi:lysyl-tRNA synthetase class 2